MLSTRWPFITSNLQLVNPRLNFRMQKRIEKLCETHGSSTATENGCRLLDRDDTRSILSFREIALYAGYVVAAATFIPASDGVIQRVVTTADLYQFKGTFARCEHPFDHTCGFGCLMARTYLKTDRPIKLNIDAMLHKHEHKVSFLIDYSSENFPFFFLREIFSVSHYVLQSKYYARNQTFQTYSGLFKFYYAIYTIKIYENNFCLFPEKDPKYRDLSQCQILTCLLIGFHAIDDDHVLK